MPDLARAAQALSRMRNALAQLQAPADRGGVGRYERATNDYQDSLLTTYRVWVKVLLKQLSGPSADGAYTIVGAIPNLTRDLQGVAQGELPAAIQALGAAYVPSPDAWRMVADAITQANTEIVVLTSNIADKLIRALAEGADVESVAQSLEPRVSMQAGAFWVLIMRAIGDFATQASQDDEIYPCRWVLDPQAQHCESCPIFAGEYPSYNAMLEATSQSVPGYFANSPYKSCWGNCRCHLELFVNGAWVRV